MNCPHCDDPLDRADCWLYAVKEPGGAPELIHCSAAGTYEPDARSIEFDTRHCALYFVGLTYQCEPGCEHCKAELSYDFPRLTKE